MYQLQNVFVLKIYSYLGNHSLGTEHFQTCALVIIRDWGIDHVSKRLHECPSPSQTTSQNLSLLGFVTRSSRTSVARGVGTRDESLTESAGEARMSHARVI